MDPDKDLSPHFTIASALFSSTAARLGIDNTPTDEILANMRVAAAGMEQVRTLLGSLPIHVDSWYRCPALNKAVGGADDSEHMKGFAADFIIPPMKLCAIIEAISSSPIQFDQLIYEFGRWVHGSFGPRMRRMILTAQHVPGQPTYVPFDPERDTN